MTARTALTAIDRLYRAALAVLPRSMRMRFAADMQRTFASRCRAAAARGGRPLMWVVIYEFVDLLRAAVAARTQLRATSPQQPPLSHYARSAAVPSLIHDLRYAFRMFWRQPAFTVVALLTLSLGIGATTAVFTVVNGVLLRPLPYAHPERLVLLLNGRNGRLGSSFSPPNFRDATANSPVFADAAAFNGTTMNLTGSGDPQRLEGVDVTWNFFSVLGAAPRLGRALAEANAANNALVVVISDALWRRLGSRPDIVGTSLRLDGRAYEVVGVAQPDTIFPAHAEYWRPLIFTAHQLDESQRGAQWINAIARLKPGVPLTQANAALATTAARLQATRPRFGNRQIAAVILQDGIVGGIRPKLLVLLGAVAMVLMIACVNVANLLLARSHARAHEVAVRAALGAGRARLLRQFLAESLALGGVGAAGGLAVAWAAARGLVALGPESIPRLADVAIDLRVLAFTIGVATIASVVFGLIPALATTSIGLPTALSASGRGTVGHSGTQLRKMLVVAEMALAVMLLAGAGLLIRSYAQLNGVNPGFSADRVLTFRLALPEAKYTSTSGIARFVTEYVDALRGRGVRAAAVYGLPLDGEFNAFSSFTRPGEVDTESSPTIGMRIVTPDYFGAMSIPLRRGRVFSERDTETSPEVVLINEEAARRYWPGIDPIGQQLHLGARLVSGVRSGQKTIVGIVGDVKYGGLDLTAAPEAFLPYTQHPAETFTIVARTSGDPLAFVPTARGELARMDPELPMAAIRPMTDIVGRSIAERRFVMLLLSSFAGVAVLLAAIGVYGVLAYVVSQRTQEIGVRLAIGATPGDVARLFVREGATLSLIGLATGLAGALAAARALTAMLFGVSATDPMTFASVAAALALVALAASYVPARRAARVDPMAALRTD